ncbi:unnamed protein product [Musa acuminata subsp. malaccensis]|uniref:(wild Malaysian banana) hypothetical protein n=1 Tax=Musa acuminata subsp. malaccensis TaxID=214687 RepID=A0A804J382_MUSAM|nr:unnamed protein product [Musa acuminata subsp. malaccensis]
MKKVGFFAASLAAVSSAALAAASPDSRASSSSSKEGPGSGTSREGGAGSGSRKVAEDKFAPRFDGLRFIETLVTAHR